MERERYVQLLPAYVRRFVEGATHRLGMAIQGDLNDVYVEQRLLRPLVEERRDAYQAELPERRRRLNVSYDLLSAELARRRAALRREPTPDAEDMAAIKREQQSLAEERDKALTRLEQTPGDVLPGSARFLAHALVLPPPG